MLVGTIVKLTRFIEQIEKRIEIVMREDDGDLVD
jgi:hypothetical protein